VKINAGLNVGAYDGDALGSMDGTVDGTTLDGFDEGLALGSDKGAYDGDALGSIMDQSMELHSMDSMKDLRLALEREHMMGTH